MNGIKQILCLSHFTSLRNFAKLINSKALYTPVEREKFQVIYDGVASANYIFSESLANGDYGEYPGVYTGARCVYEIGRPLTEFGFSDVILIFSTYLLKRPDYHFNILDDNGYITHRSFVSDTIHKLPDLGEYVQTYEEEFGRPHPGNEVVFHNMIPLEYLQSIWVPDQCMAMAVRKLMPTELQGSISVEIVSHVVNKTYNKKVSSKTFEEAFKSNFAAPFRDVHLTQGSYLRRDEFKEYKLKHAQNCGMSVDEIYQVGGPDLDSEKLNAYLMKHLVPDAIVGKYNPPIKFSPPFYEDVIIDRLLF